MQVVFIFVPNFFFLQGAKIKSNVMMCGGKGSKRNKGEGDAVMSVVTLRMRLGSNIYEKNAHKIRGRGNSYAAVSCSRQYAPQWELNFYMCKQDLFLLNPKILIPTCFPVEMAVVKMGQMTYRVRRAPPSQPIPLHSTDWGPEGRLPMSFCISSTSTTHTDQEQ